MATIGAVGVEWNVHPERKFQAGQVMTGGSMSSCIAFCARRSIEFIVVLLLWPGAPAQGAEIADPKAWMTDGPVFTSGIRDGILYVGGAFNYIGPRTGGLVDVERGSGRVLATWPEVEGAINAIAPDGAVSMSKLGEGAAADSGHGS